MSRILVVDDEENIRLLLRTSLEKEGFEVEEAVDGKDAIRLFRENPADLIITDIIMPEQEGLEMIMILRKEFPDAKIVAISGGGWVESKHYLEAAEQLGVLRSFAKPFDINVLVGAVKEYVG